jgi:transcriptional regulator of arginine metabolism
LKSKVARQDAIRRLVQEKRLSTQGELVKELAGEGFEATQATVSRDILELRLQKIRTAHGSIYVLPQTGIAEEIEHLQRMLSDFANAITRAGNLIILKTSPGAAQGVAAALDNTRWVEIIGTIAGDDTILLVTADSKSSRMVARKLEKLRSS